MRTGLGSALGLIADEASRPVTMWPQRLALTLVFLAIVALSFWGMWRGWRNRAKRQDHLPELDTPPADLGEVLASAEGRYVGTVRSGDWLDRIVARGLGAPGRVAVQVSAAGILLDRDGEAEVFIPAEVITRVEAGKGLAGEVVERDGLAIVGWLLGDTELDTAFRADRAADQRAVMDATAGLIAARTGG